MECLRSDTDCLGGVLGDSDLVCVVGGDCDSLTTCVFVLYCNALSFRCLHPEQQKGLCVVVRETNR